MRPKRAAAVVAEELNRQEIAQGLEEGEDDDDEEYVGEAEEAGAAAPIKRGRSTTTTSSQYTTRLRNQADEWFAALNPPRAQSSQVLARLKRDMAEEQAVTDKKKTAGSLWRDPMLCSFVSSPTRQGMPVSAEAVQLAKDTLDAFGKTHVAEQVRFAGETLQVMRSVADKQEEEATRPKSMLEEMLEGISKRRSITTVEKSSYDWDKYKQANQHLEEELKDAGKDGFVAKQQFLHRVDDRQFELERAQRERERALRDLKQQ